jgi:hypothetical protein
LGEEAPVFRLRGEKRGQSYPPGKVSHRCPAEEDETGCVLRPVVEAYLGGSETTSTELALQAYLKRSITAPNCVVGLRQRVVTRLRECVGDLYTREELEEWIGDALELRIDPL